MFESLATISLAIIAPPEDMGFTISYLGTLVKASVLKVTSQLLTQAGLLGHVATICWSLRAETNTVQPCAKPFHGGNNTRIQASLLKSAQFPARRSVFPRIAFL